MFLILLASLTLLQSGDAFRLNLGKSSPMEDMLDMVQQMMTGEEQFDRTLIKEVRTCMATFDPNLPDVHDKMWQGIIDFWDMRGNPDDRWGATDTLYGEENVTVSSYRGMIIHEPCNVASNIAYYHLLLEFCKRRADDSRFNFRSKYINALGTIVADFTPASVLFHGSHTKLGYQQDDGTIRIMAYLQHQGIMETLPYRSSVLNDLSPTPRPLTALQIVDAAQDLYSTQPVSNWLRIYDKFDMPDYYLGFAGSGVTMMHLLFPDFIVQRMIPIALGAFGLTREQQLFMKNEFLPELKKATQSMDRKQILRNNFVGNTVGAMAKMIHAFVWQEYLLFNHSILLKTFPNMIGSLIAPTVNRKLNLAINYDYFQPDFQRGVNIYPGEQWCNPLYAHAKWHVLNAIALLDLLYVGDDIIEVIAPS